MTTDTWAQRALSHTRFLTEHIGPRSANSPEERLAADYVLAQLRASGISESRLEACRAARSAWLPVAILFSIAVWGSIICWAGSYLTRVVAIGALIGAGLCLLALWTIYRHFAFKDYPLRRWLARATGHNAIGRLAPTADTQQRVVLMAQLDSPHHSWIFQTLRRRRFFQIALTISVISLGVGGVMFLLGAANVWGWAFVAAAICGFAQGGGVLLAIQADQGDSTSNANENASGLGLLLALGERLSQTPLAHTEVWLLACSSHTTDSGGLRSFIDQHHAEIGDAWFIGFDRVGIGERTIYFNSSWPTHALTREIQQLLEQAGIAAGSQPPIGRPTPIGVAQVRGYRGMCLSTMGVGTARATASLQVSAFRQAHQSALDLLHIIDQQKVRSTRFRR